jgi:hypothetical protein
MRSRTEDKESQPSQSNTNVLMTTKTKSVYTPTVGIAASSAIALTGLRHRNKASTKAVKLSTNPNHNDVHQYDLGETKAILNQIHVAMDSGMLSTGKSRETRGLFLNWTKKVASFAYCPE